MAKKKSKRRPARTMPTQDAVKAITRPEPESTVALQLRLPCAYELLGYYHLQRPPGVSPDTEMPAYVLVTVLDGENPSRYATYQVVDMTGKCILPRFFGEDELHTAHEDFWRRTRVTEPRTKAARAPTSRQAWKEKVLNMADQQQAGRTPAHGTSKEKGK